MRIILLVLIIFGGCSAQNSESAHIPWTQIHPEYLHRLDYNGIYTELNQNSWNYKSHMVPNPWPETPGVYCHYCKKVMTHHQDKPYIKGRQVIYFFDLTVNKWNFIDPPRRIIIWQNWLQVKAGRNNHPLSTLKLMRWKGLSLGLFSTAWQWKSHLVRPYDVEDPKDKMHRHPFAQNDGSIKLEVGKKYRIELGFVDGLTPKDGNVYLFVEGEQVGHSQNQIRSLTNKSTMLWGQYWEGGFKNGYNGGIKNKCEAKTGIPDLVCKSNQITIENLRMFERIVK